MDVLFENSPLFVARTPYAKVEDHRAAERELRQGEFVFITALANGNQYSKGTFVPGALTEEKATDRQRDEEGKGLTEHND